MLRQQFFKEQCLWCGLELSGSGEGPVAEFVNTLTKFRTAWTAGNFLNRWATISFSRRTLLHGVNCLVKIYSEQDW